MGSTLSLERRGTGANGVLPFESLELESFTAPRAPDSPLPQTGKGWEWGWEERGRRCAQKLRPVPAAFAWGWGLAWAHLDTAQDLLPPGNRHPGTHFRLGQVQ